MRSTVIGAQGCRGWRIYIAVPFRSPLEKSSYGRLRRVVVEDGAVPGGTVEYERVRADHPCELLRRLCVDGVVMGGGDRGDGISSCLRKGLESYCMEDGHCAPSPGATNDRPPGAVTARLPRLLRVGSRRVGDWHVGSRV